MPTASKDWTTFDTIEIIGINVPVDSNMYIQLKIYAGAWSEYTFTQNGTATDYSLKLDYDSAAPSLYNWGTMDWSNVQVIKFEVNGDISDIATSGSILIDNINLVPEPMTLALLGLGGLFIRRKQSK